MGVNPKYKQSEVGPIPLDWHISPLGRLVRSVEYGSSAKSERSGRIPVLRMGNLQDGKIDWTDLVFTDNAAEISKYSLRAGDVLFNRTNTVDLVGKTSIYEGEQPAIFAGYLIRINVVPDLLDSRFLNYVLNANFSRRHSARVLSVAVGQANINGQKLKTYPIPMPPTKAEQESIAAALSDADELIGALEKLIAKKRAIKLAAMQQLLTGKTRLSGFRCNRSLTKLDGVVVPADWTVRRLGSLGQWRGGSTPSMSVPKYWVNGNIPWVSSSDVRYGVLHNTQSCITQCAVAETSVPVLPDGAILLVVRSGILRRFLPVARTARTMAVNQDIKGLLPNPSFNSDFIQQMLTHQQSVILTRCLKSGTTVESIEFRWLKAFPIPFPCLDEQVAIAGVLASMDAEITTLERRRHKTKAIKQGMMQALLTGRVRLVKPDRGGEETT